MGLPTKIGNTSPMNDEDADQMITDMSESFWEHERLRNQAEEAIRRFFEQMAVNRFIEEQEMEERVENEEDEIGINSHDGAFEVEEQEEDQEVEYNVENDIDWNEKVGWMRTITIRSTKWMIRKMRNMAITIRKIISCF